METESPVLNFAPKVCFKKKSRDRPGLRADQAWPTEDGDLSLTVVSAMSRDGHRGPWLELHLPLMKRFCRKHCLCSACL